MISSLVSFVALSVVSSLLANAQGTINSPSGVVFCEPTLLTWSGGVTPYASVEILPGGEVSASPLEVLLTDTNLTSLTWTCNVAPSTYVTFALKDGSGALSYSAAVLIGGTANSTCASVNSTVTGVASIASTAASTAGSTTVTSTTSTSTTTTSSTSSSQTTSTVATTSTTTSAAASSTTTSAAPFSYNVNPRALLAVLLFSAFYLSGSL